MKLHGMNTMVPRWRFNFPSILLLLNILNLQVGACRILHESDPDAFDIPKRELQDVGSKPNVENPFDGDMQRGQYLWTRKTTMMEGKRESGITEDELHQVILTAVCKGANAQNKQAECRKAEKRQYRRMTPVDKREYRAAKVQWEKGIVPYAFDKKYAETESGKNEILRAMKYLESVSCVTFVGYTPDVYKQYGLHHTAYLNFLNKGDGRCWSDTGQAPGGKQDISACGKFDSATHEILHALGSEHEQARADREKWIQILLVNAEPDRLRDFERFPDTKTYGTKYDYASVMHYGQFSFSRNRKYPTIAIYDKDTRFLVGRRGLLSHEDKMALNGAYKCKDTKCPMFAEACQHSGFVGYQNKKCQCVCPSGLMGRNCEKTYKAINLPAEWPSGDYGLPRPTTGCPWGSWKTGSLNQTLACCCNRASVNFHMKKRTHNEQHVSHQFCMRGSAGSNPVNWMPGKYCVYKKGACPAGFKVGSLQLDIAKGDGQNDVSGELPDGMFGRETKLYYCCRNDGVEEASIRLPVSKPFYLFMVENATTCQSVEGARFSEEYFLFEMRDNSTGATEELHPKLNHIIQKYQKAYQLHYCYYEPISYECGGIIQLKGSRDIRHIKTPNYPRNYGDDRECIWVITSPAGTQIQVAMDDFDVADDASKSCLDSLEIKHYMLSQPGPRYCGSHFTKSITSIYNSMMLVFRTGVSRTSGVSGVTRGFNAQVSIIKRSRYNCYTLADLGRTYSGKVNYTSDYRKCVTWTAASRCPYTLWNQHSFGTGNHNYCRNPSGAKQPWCYVNDTTCQLGLCDVCGIDLCYDEMADCANLIQSKPGYCSTDDGFTRCHKTCGHCGVGMAKQAMSCSPPPTPLSSSFVPKSLKPSYNIGEIVKYRCDVGLGLYTTVCLSDGTWSGSSNMCGAICEDTLDCDELIDNYPNMCAEHKLFAASNCRRTCKLCG